jgi:HK97 family phage prohead protease
MQKFQVKAEVKIKKDKILAIASEEVEDRDGEVLTVDGWKLDNFIKNPQFLWYHNLRPERSLPIGKVKNIKVMKIGGSKKLVFEPEFEDITEFGKTVAEFVKRGYLNSFSVGFKPLEKTGNTYKEQELLEISLVPVPALPQAQVIQLAEEAGISKVMIKAVTGDAEAAEKVLHDGKKELDGGELNKKAAKKKIKKFKKDVSTDEKIEKLFKLIKNIRRDVRKSLPGKKIKDDVITHDDLVQALKIVSKGANLALREYNRILNSKTKKEVNI